MTAPVRAAHYLWVSTGWQADNNLSIPDQRRQAKATARRGWKIVADYVEPGVWVVNWNFDVNRVARQTDHVCDRDTRRENKCASA
jgi:hypothetical protein